MAEESAFDWLTDSEDRRGTDISMKNLRLLIIVVSHEISRRLVLINRIKYVV